jgi:thymidylate synthase (FAD)
MPAPDTTAPSPPVTRVPAEAPLVDCLGGCSRHEVRIHEHGFIALIDAMPRLVPEGQTADYAIVQAARVSYGQGTRKIHEDRGLIRYLLRHRHTTPFEMVEFKFHVSMPIFIARQWIRHRTANVNEYSGRYSVIPDHFYRPTLDAVRKQSAANRQGGEATFAVPEGAEPGAAGHDEARTAQQFLDYLGRAEALYHEYESLLSRGVSRELARVGLPVSVYTQWYWKCDLHNILRFLALRMDAHAQLEIRDYAEAMLALLQPIVPITVEAWRDYEFEAVHLSRLEARAIRSIATGGTGDLPGDNKREQAEWAAKRARLGLDDLRAKGE